MSARAILVGAGLMGRWHAHAIGKAGGRVVAVVDSDLSAAMALSDLAGGVALTSLADALDRHATVVHVCTPSAAHVDQVSSALEAGAHVVVEKPVTDARRDTRALCDLADARGLSLTPVLQFGWQPWTERVPDLGELTSLRHDICSVGGEGLSEHARTHLAWGIAWHGLGLAQQFLPGGLSGIDWSVSRPAAGEIVALGSGPGPVSLSVSLRGRPPRNELVLVGTRATLRADLFHGFGTVEGSGASRTDKALRPFRQATGALAGAATNLGRRALSGEPAFPGLNALIEAVYRHAAGDGPPPMSTATLLAIADAADALRGEPA
ncbi:MAG: Gfo/Idh/MocA family oxidoreductase [Deltaproteobacteria bacterium]|nr:Gfo/Idh/MocA family oxidoreductase [Deltaproteobacteria bacterium]